MDAAVFACYDDRTGRSLRTDYAYDALDRQISASSPSPSRGEGGGEGVIGSFTHYNSIGQVDWTMDAASNVTAYAYDPATGQRISVTDALSNTVYTAYDAEGRQVGTWGATYPVFYDFDAYGRMSAMYTLRDSSLAITNYSSFITHTSSFDRTAWQYDQATGLLTNKVYADGNGTAYAYTSDGRLSRRTWARNVATDYSYDSLGQMTNIVYSDGTPGVTFVYDRLGRQAAIADGTGSRTFAYNAALQLAAETNVFGSIGRSYDALGRSAGFSLDAGYAVAYGYDPVGRFASVSNNVGAVPRTATYSYLPGSGLLAGWTNDAGMSLARTYEPNRDLLTAVENRFGTNLISRFDYSNDAVGRRTRRIDSASVTNVFGYNIRSELVEAAMPLSQQPSTINHYWYAYDPIGNRQTASNNAEALTYAANALNQYTNIADGVTNAPTYDADGNLVSYGGWTFSWDAENRLVLASNVATVVSNAYDYMSRRVSKSVNGTARQFAYDGWAMVRETTAGETNDYVYGLDLSGSLQGAGTIGGLLCNLRSSLSNTSCAFYAYDANGNVTDLIDTNGVSVAHYEYDPYGNLTQASGSESSANPFRFSTKYLDSEVGLYYYGLRFYSAEVGRWLSKDPLQEGVVVPRSPPKTRWGANGSYEVNSYEAAGNNPLMYVDPFGLAIINVRRLGDCSCKYEDVNKAGCAGGKAAFDASVAEPFPSNALLPGSRKRERGGRVCCNKKTKQTSFTGPIRGPWPKQIAGTVNGQQWYLYGIGIISVHPDYAPLCSVQLGHDWEEAGFYHSHPDSPDFSTMNPGQPSDEDFVIHHAQPFFLYCNGTCKRMDRMEGTYVNGPTTATVPGTQVCTVDPTTGSYSCNIPPIFYIP